MTAYEINILRTNGTCEIYPCETDALPTPPESGDRWDLPDLTYYVADLSRVACIEVVGGVQDAKPWHVWQVVFDFARDAEDRDYFVGGTPALAPEIPASGTWWALKASRGDEPACDPKNDLFVRRGNLMSINPGGSPTTCQ